MGKFGDSGAIAKWEWLHMTGSEQVVKTHKPGSQRLKNGVSYITIILQKCGKLGAELENLCNRNYHVFVFMTTNRVKV